MISGSYTGGISFFKGDGAGGFRGEEKVKSTAGKPVTAEYSPSPCVGDWDGDGDLDLVVGVIAGSVKVFKNQGNFVFDAGSELKSGKYLLTKSDGGPCVVDWDGDGILDLLMGDSLGGVEFFRRKDPISNTLEPPVVLVKPDTVNGYAPVLRDPKSKTGLSIRRPGKRTKPYAADWNGDGKLDLLVGDFMFVKEPEPKLTKVQLKERERLARRSISLSSQLQPIYKRISNRAEALSGVTLADRNLTQETYKEWAAAHAKAMSEDKEYKKLSGELSAVTQKLTKMSAGRTMTGFVWVYLRK